MNPVIISHLNCQENVLLKPAVIATVIPPKGRTVEDQQSHCFSLISFSLQRDQDNDFSLFASFKWDQ